MRVLVLGGNRFIGSRLVSELHRQGHEVTVFNSHATDLPPGVRRLHGDRREPGVIGSVLGDHRDEFEAVFDNTAYGVPDLAPLVELFRGHIAHFVFTSSIAVYRPSDIQPISEDFPVTDDDGRNVYGRYGAGKMRCEDYLFAEHQRDGFPATSIRVCHTCGPHNNVAVREPAYFARLEQRRPILIPGDGFTSLHFVHVDDVAALMVSVLGNERAAGQAYNAAGPEVVSIVGWVRLLAEVVGVEPQLMHLPIERVRSVPQPLIPWREWEIGGMSFSTGKALAELEWSARYGVKAAFEDAYRWFSTGGREEYKFDFSVDEEVLAAITT